MTLGRQALGEHGSTAGDNPHVGGGAPFRWDRSDLKESSEFAVHVTQGRRSMNITVPVIQVLWAHAHNQCAFPGCQQALVQESVDVTTGEVSTTPTGEQAFQVCWIPGSRR